MACTHTLAMIKMIRDIFDVRGIDFDEMHFAQHPTRELHYTADGIATYVKSSDGHDYRIEISPVRTPLSAAPLGVIHA